MQPIDLTGKTVLVTGASSGIGRAAALDCSRLGAKVVLTGRDAKRLEETRARLSGEGHLSLVQDFSGQEDLEPFFRKMLSETGRLDGMIHCAGIPGVIPLRALSRKQLEPVMEINFYSFVELVRQFAKKRYSRDGASVVALSAALIHRPRPYELAYVASKAALEAAVPVLAMELRGRKIRVNSMSPGAVRTEMLDRLAEELDNRDFLESGGGVSAVNWQTPEEVAKVCAFLISDAASAMNGRNILADGGFL